MKSNYKNRMNDARFMRKGEELLQGIGLGATVAMKAIFENFILSYEEAVEVKDMIMEKLQEEIDPNIDEIICLDIKKGKENNI